MELSSVVILGIIEGVTEFLPISSTAHLILASHILAIPKTDFLSTFEIGIQFGAILAVVVTYLNKLLKSRKLFFKAIVAFIPTGALGLFFFKYIKALFSNPLIPVVVLFLGGIAIILIEKYFESRIKNDKLRAAIVRPEEENEQTPQLHKEHISQPKNIQNMSYKDALIIGLIQSLAMIPGVSRSAASIFGAMALRFNRMDAVEFSFILAIPTMTVATLFDVMQFSGNISPSQIYSLIVGMVVAFITALFTIRYLLIYIQKNNFVIFGAYRIILAIFYYLFFLQ